MPAIDDRCGGALEAQIWVLWDAQGRKFLQEQLIHDRLLTQGDSYALYDIQIYFHNLEAMAERCQRTDRLLQLADDLMPLFGALQPLPGKPAELGWICRGGAVCNARSRLTGNEVMLVSVQGLGLLSALARALAASPSVQARTHPFIRQTVQASVAHLLRWGDAAENQRWLRLTQAQAQDVKDSNSALFFTDHLLWQIAVYANLAGIAERQPDLLRSIGIERMVQHKLAQNFGMLLGLFQRRLSLATHDSPLLGRVTVADLDRGFWRLYTDNRYAGYTGAEPPAVCVQGAAQLMVSPENIAPVADLGWDFSHARRLVPVLDALDLNRQALKTWYSLPPAALPPDNLPQAFAAQLLTTVWNGDAQMPLFTNYWSGANGWYRVAYDNGTGRCYPGYPPFGLSDSFATGGYITWGRYYPQISELGCTIFNRSRSSQPDDRKYIKTHYPGLSPAASVNDRMLTQLMFWPGLIQ